MASPNPPGPTLSETIPSPLGPLTITATTTALVSVDISTGPKSTATASKHAHPVISLVANQLQEYFTGTRHHFDVPVDTPGTAFQQAVWATLIDIPYGQTLSYGEVAEAIGRPGSARAVGGAVGANPIPIIIPCHRVMGANGAMTGYSGGGGISTKRSLLDHESTTVAVMPLGL